MFKISTSVPSASRQWVMSACQRSLGWSAQNLCHDERGRFCGCGVTNPRRDRIRQIVETAGTGATPAVGQVGGDGLRAGVQALLRQRLAEPDDLVLHLQHRPRAGCVRPPRARLERRLALGLEPFDQLSAPRTGRCRSRGPPRSCCVPPR